MAGMVAERYQGFQYICNPFSHFSSIFIGLMLLFFQGQSLAKDWELIPSLTFAETFSDNISLASPGNEQSAFVTEVNPGLSFRYNTAVNRINLNYRMQNIFNAGGDERWDIFNQLGFNSNTRLIRNTLFLDVNSSISQQNTINLNRPNDNLQGNALRTNVTTVGVSPYWTPHLNGYADGEVRFRYNRIMTDDSLASDTNIYEESVRLNSGWRFSRVTWFAEFNNRDEERESGDNVTFQNSIGEVRLHLGRKFSVFAQAGHSNNDFITTTTTNNNGVFYSFGGAWVPSRQFFLEAAYGNNSFVTMGIRPMKHMNWITTWRYNEVGTNTGTTWDTSLDYRTKRAVWRARYFEDTKTTQDVLSSLQPFTIQDEFGNPINDPVTNQPIQGSIPVPTLIDQVFTRKRGELSFSYRTGKSNFNTTLFNERRTFQVSQTDDDVSGVSAFWNWQFIRRSFFFVRPLWQRTNNAISTDDRYEVALGFSRVIPIIKFGRRRPVAGRIEYQYTKQTSDLAANEFTENRVSASLLFTF